MSNQSLAPPPLPARSAPTPITAPRRRWWVLAAPAVVAIIVSVLLIVSAGDALAPTTPVRVSPVIPVRDQAPTQADPTPAQRPAPRSTVTVQAPGWLEADPFYVACTALADGVVAEMLVLEGERVEKGQIVARLVGDDARIALAKADADLASAQAELLIVHADLYAAQTDWDHPVERRRAVASTRAALGEIEAELVQLPSIIASERADLERMEEEWRRSEQALESGAATDIEVIILRKHTESQAAMLVATERREEILIARRDRLSAEHAAAERNAQLRISERRALDTAKAQEARARAAVSVAEAERDDAQLRFVRMTIRAPIDGFVQRRLKVPGDKVMLGMDDPRSSQIVLLYDPSSIQVRVDVPLAEASHIFEGQRCEVIVDVLPDEVFEGVVSRITHEADLQKNTLQAKVHVIDPSPLLRPEMLTRVKFLPDTTEDEGRPIGAAHSLTPLVLISEKSLHARSGNRARVLAVRDRRGDHGAIRAIDIEIIEIEDGWARVRGPIRPGDLLVVEPESLGAGQRVRVRDAADAEGGAS